MMPAEARTGFLDEELIRLQHLGQLRVLRRLAVTADRRINFQGQELVNFSSNDYLGLAQHPRVKQAAKEAIDQYAASASSSRLICGNFDLHEQLEEELANFKDQETALVFSSGYLANIGILSALAGEQDHIFSDALNHASIIDGCRLSRATIRVFRHRDLAHLEECLKACSPRGRRLIVSDSVFSMDGDLADLPGLMSLAEKYECLLVLDEAHATGVLGKSGCGLKEHFVDRGALSGARHRVDVEMGTLSKALGSLGGYVACSRSMRDYLINKSRSFIFSTALPPSALGAARASLKLVRQGSDLRQKLWNNVALLQRLLHGFDCASEHSETPIFPIHFGSETKALQASETLMRKGYFVPAIRPPSVPKGTSRLRLTVTATHTVAEIESLAQALREMRS